MLVFQKIFLHTKGMIPNTSIGLSSWFLNMKLSEISEQRVAFSVHHFSFRQTFFGQKFVRKAKSNLFY